MVFSEAVTGSHPSDDRVTAATRLWTPRLIDSLGEGVERRYCR